jgi:RNA polymerase sigma factor (sigma-70 family)
VRRNEVASRAGETMIPRNSAGLVEDWYDRWHSLLVRLLSNRVADRAEAQDLAQEVFLRLLRVDTLDLVKNPRAYVYRVAVNVAGEWRLRARQRMPHTAKELDELVSVEDLERTLEERQTGDAVRRALAELPPVLQQVLVLHCREGMTYEKIADTLGVTRRMVKRYVAKGYAAMRERMTPQLCPRRETDE